MKLAPRPPNNYNNADPEMKIDEVIWDDAVYPRAAVSQNTLAAYVEALSIGAQFPPVMVQRVRKTPADPSPYLTTTGS
jgi:hypothetical protein